MDLSVFFYNILCLPYEMYELITNYCNSPTHTEDCITHFSIDSNSGLDADKYLSFISPFCKYDTTIINSNIYVYNKLTKKLFIESFKNKKYLQTLSDEIYYYNNKICVNDCLKKTCKISMFDTDCNFFGCLSFKTDVVIKNIRLYDNKIYTLCDKGIYMYDFFGNCINKINIECVELNDFKVYDGVIYIFVTILFEDSEYYCIMLMTYSVDGNKIYEQFINKYPKDCEIFMHFSCDVYNHELYYVFSEIYNVDICDYELEKRRSIKIKGNEVRYIQIVGNLLFILSNHFYLKFHVYKIKKNKPQLIYIKKSIC